MRQTQVLDVREHCLDDVLDTAEQRLGVDLDRASCLHGISGATSGFRTHRDTWVRLQHRSHQRCPSPAWTAEETAAALHGVKKPVWIQAVCWRDEQRGLAWRADELELICSPVLGDVTGHQPTPELSDQWWTQLTASLQALHTQHTDRVAMTQETLTRQITDAFGEGIDTHIDQWETAHGDLHWGNLTRQAHLLDWEGWGRAPRGVDAASLWAVSLPYPQIAARIEHEFAADLQTRSGQLAHLALCSRALHAGRQRPDLAHLLPLAQHTAERLLAELAGAPNRVVQRHGGFVRGS